jgi:hypothetical protein
MPFFQNPFFQDFRGNLVIADRQQALTFECKQHAERGFTRLISVPQGTFDLSGTDSDGNSLADLELNFAVDPNLIEFATISVDVTTLAASSASITPREIVASLNADGPFSGWFKASIENLSIGGTVPEHRVVIESKLPEKQIKFYIGNTGAETELLFNAKAGVCEMPCYFSRHTVENRHDFDDSNAILIELDPGSSVVDADIIDNAVDAKGNSLGFDSSVVKEDYELLRGRSGLFVFKKITVDASDRITEIIEYHAGAQEGDFAKKTEMTYTGTNCNPDQVTEIPHCLESGDFITPP